MDSNSTPKLRMSIKSADLKPVARMSPFTLVLLRLPRSPELSKTGNSAKLTLHRRRILWISSKTDLTMHLPSERRCLCSTIKLQSPSMSEPTPLFNTLVNRRLTWTTSAWQLPSRRIELALGSRKSETWWLWSKRISRELALQVSIARVASTILWSSGRTLMSSSSTPTIKQTNNRLN